MPVTTGVEDLQQPGALELLRSPDPARLAYTGPDGYPRVIPIGFLWNGTAVFLTFEGTRDAKVREGIRG